MKFEACMDIMDLLYEKEETSVLYRSPRSLAASILARLLHFLGSYNVMGIDFDIFFLISFSSKEFSMLHR